MANNNPKMVEATCVYDSADECITLYGIDFKKSGKVYTAKVVEKDVASLVEAGKLKLG